MNKQQDLSGNAIPRTEQTLEGNSARGGNDFIDGIGAGKKTGLSEDAIVLLAIVIIFIVLVLTGIYNPFQGTEGVGQ